MTRELSDDDVELVVKALEHCHAYLVAMRREDGRYKDLAERLQRKGPGKQVKPEPVKRKRG